MGNGARKYRPSNGTEGRDFIDRWCVECQRDEEYRQTEQNPCDILCRSLMYKKDEPEYPEEWTYDAANEPCCTAFVPLERAPTDTELEAAGQLNILNDAA